MTVTALDRARIVVVSLSPRVIARDRPPSQSSPAPAIARGDRSRATARPGSTYPGAGGPRRRAGFPASFSQARRRPYHADPTRGRIRRDAARDRAPRSQLRSWSPRHPCSRAVEIGDAAAFPDDQLRCKERVLTETRGTSGRAADDLRARAPSRQWATIHPAPMVRRLRRPSREAGCRRAARLPGQAPVPEGHSISGSPLGAHPSASTEPPQDPTAPTPPCRRTEIDPDRLDDMSGPLADATPDRSIHHSHTGSSSAPAAAHPAARLMRS